MSGEESTMKSVNGEEWHDDYRPHRAWAMTISAGEQNGVPTIAPSAIMAGLKSVDVDADWVFQMERGKDRTERNPEGYLHYQVAVSLGRNGAKSLRSITKKIASVIGENVGYAAPVKKNEIASGRYASKNDGTRQAGPWWSSDGYKSRILGGKSASRQGERSDMEAVASALLNGKSTDELLMENPLLLPNGSAIAWADRIEFAVESTECRSRMRHVDGHYLYGPTGTGKSWTAMHSRPLTDIYRVPVGSRHMWDAYQGESTIVFDEFRGQVDLSLMLLVMDEYPLQLDRRYRNRWARWTDVWLTSNWPIGDLYTHASSADRGAFLRRFSDVRLLNERYIGGNE